MSEENPVQAVEKAGAGIEYAEDVSDTVQALYGRGTEVTMPEEEGTYWQILWRRRRLILRLSIIYIAVMNVGFDNSITGTTQGMAAFRKYFGEESLTKPGTYIIPAKYQSGWAAATSGGQVLTDLIADIIADRFGRKFTLTLSVFVIMIASTVQITAHSIGQVIAGKAVLGMGIGLYISFITSYVAELAPARLRGGACIGVNFFPQVGSWVGAGSALALTKRYPDVNDTNSFRIMFAFQYIFSTLFLLLVY
jgi:MFS family permease